MDKIAKIYYINLDSRTDRNKKILHEFEKLKVTNFERFSAVKSQFGGRNGCTLSHVRLWNIINNVHKDDYIMILEDDATFTVKRKKLDKIISEFVSLKSKKILALGFHKMTNSTDIYKKNRTFYYCFNFLTTSAYVLHGSLASKLLEHFNNQKIDFLNDVNTGIIVDIYIKMFQRKGYYIIPREHIVVQRKSYSDIEGRVVKYNA